MLAQSLTFPEVDYEPQRSPFDLRAKQPPPESSQDTTRDGAAAAAEPSGRHVRMPSFPVVDYEPETRGGSNSPASPVRPRPYVAR